jgi:hypothetical protein
MYSHQQPNLPANNWVNNTGFIPNRNYDPYNPQADRVHRKNTPARNSLLLGILSLLLNPLGLPAIGAMVWGALGVTRANQWAREGLTPIGKSMAIRGIVLGFISHLGMVLLLLFVI